MSPFSRPLFRACPSSARPEYVLVLRLFNTRPEVIGKLSPIRTKYLRLQYCNYIVNIFNRLLR